MCFVSAARRTMGGGHHPEPKVYISDKIPDSLRKSMQTFQVGTWFQFWCCNFSFFLLFWNVRPKTRFRCFWRADRPTRRSSWPRWRCAESAFSACCDSSGALASPPRRSKKCWWWWWYSLLSNERFWIDHVCIKTEVYLNLITILFRTNEQMVSKERRKQTDNSQ